MAGSDLREGDPDLAPLLELRPKSARDRRAGSCGAGAAPLAELDPSPIGLAGEAVLMSYLRLLALAGILLALTRCSEPEGTATKGGPDILSGPPFFTAMLDGAPWVADTAEGIVLTPSAGGVATLVIGTRRVA